VKGSRFSEDELSLQIRERDRQMAASDKEHSPKGGYDFTGERFIPQRTDPLLALEHYHRYCFAARFAENRRVLDIACGEGYGSAFLAKWAKEVIGIDSDADTIDHAGNKYSSMSNLSFQVGRCEASHEHLGGFDLVVSYETIEHLTEHDQVELLNHIGKVLGQDGLFICSSPDKNEYAAAGQSKNQFHKHEMTLTELKSRLQTYFRHVYLYGQRILSLSAMWKLDGWRDAPFRFYARNELLEEVPVGESFSPPLYVIALCSNRALQSETIAEANSFYFDTANVEKTKDLYEWAMRMDADVQKSREVVQNLEQELGKRASWALDLQQDIKNHTERIDSQNKEIEERTRWARSLETEVKKERAHSAQLKETLEERTQWARSLEAEVSKERAHALKLRKELEQITSSLVYRLLRKIGLFPAASDGK